ncbi:putative transposase [Lentzea waywayandensis]|uniref:Putative transposase n=1 Tax=Lentzea waywayandensis TaxID=84724 RepID=A0A1I6EIQ9_9PSEU|nr:putative transposase [Lentzea waywayandensis]
MLNRTFGCVRLVWNKTLGERNHRFRTKGARTTYRETDTDVAELDPTMVVISRDPDGRWYVTFSVDTEAPVPTRPVSHSIGVDLGLSDFLVTSDGERIANPRHLAGKARNLARHQRRLARCRRGSSNRRKAKAKVARAHRKVRNARQDFLHRTTTRLVRPADVIAIEDLNIRGMVRNHHLARAISDAGWGEFRRQLEYKCSRAGRSLVVIDRWFPSSKICSTCGHRLAQLSLSARHWTCQGCRTRHDRDLNAAKNILAAGRAVARAGSGNACGADVRRQGPTLPRSAAKQETRTSGKAK